MGPFYIFGIFKREAPFFIFGIFKRGPSFTFFVLSKGGGPGPLNRPLNMVFDTEQTVRHNELSFYGIVYNVSLIGHVG